MSSLGNDNPFSTREARQTGTAAVRVEAKSRDEYYRKRDSFPRNRSSSRGRSRSGEPTYGGMVKPRAPSSSPPSQRYAAQTGKKFGVQHKQTRWFFRESICHVCRKQKLPPSRIPESYNEYFALDGDLTDPWRVDCCSRCQRGFCFKHIGGYTRIGIAYCSECKSDRDDSADANRRQLKDKLRADSSEGFKRAKVTKPSRSGPLGPDLPGGDGSSSSSQWNASGIDAVSDPERLAKTPRRDDYHK